MVADGKAWVVRNGSRKNCLLGMLYSINKSSWSQAPSPLLMPNIHPLCGVVNGVDLDLGSEEEMWFSSKIMDKELKMIDWSGTATNWRSLLGNGVLLSAVLDHPRYLINSVFQYNLSLCHDLTSLVAKRLFMRRFWCVLLTFSLDAIPFQFIYCGLRHHLPIFLGFVLDKG